MFLKKAIVIVAVVIMHFSNSISVFGQKGDAISDFYASTAENSKDERKRVGQVNQYLVELLNFRLDCCQNKIIAWR